MEISGWMVDYAGPGGTIAITVDDRPISAPIQKLPRPDLHAAYPDAAAVGEVTGFRVQLESAQFADGEHRLSCIARRGEAETVIASGTFLVQNGPRAYLGALFLKGSGLEIGALHSPHPVPSSCERVTYVDRLDVDGLRRHYPELADKPLVTVDVIDDGEELKTFAPSSQDFIIANHFLEHTQDPIGTIERHLEVLRPGGILFMAIPDKRQTFDLPRPVTTLEHLYRDHEEGPAWSYMDHVREVVSLVGKMSGAVAEAGVKKIVDTQYSLHFHVWTQNELLEMLVDIRRRLALPFDIEAVVQNGVESLVVLRKRHEPLP
jgi:predicted SAM-dependent methyltransferase